MKDFKDFLEELEEGLKPEHNMRPGWMIKADPVLKAKIDANKAKQKEIKNLMGKKLKEESVLDEDRLPERHKVQVTASKNGGPKEKIDMKVHATSQAEAKGIARMKLHKQGYTTHSAIHHGIDYSWLKKEETDMCSVCGQTPCNCTHIEEETKWKVSYDVHGSNKDVPLYSNHHHIRAKSGEEAISIVKKLVGGTKHKAELVKEEQIKESNDHYEEAEEHKNKASKALEISDMEAHHFHMSNHHEAMGRWHESKGRHSSADREYAKAEEHHEKSINASKAPSRSVKSTNEEVEQVNELSSDLLARYKEKAGLAATAADKAKKYDLGHKRFKGIMKATFKQFANDAKK